MMKGSKRNNKLHLTVLQAVYRLRVGKGSLIKFIREHKHCVSAFKALKHLHSANYIYTTKKGGSSVTFKGRKLLAKVKMLN